MKEKELKKTYWFSNHFSTILICILLSFVVWQTISLCSIEKQFENFKENLSLTEKVSEKNENLKLINTFKEDAYIRHQERDTTLILAVFGLITIAFGFFTFKGVRDEFSYKIKEIKELDLQRQEAFELTKKEIDKLNSDINFQFLVSSIEMAEKFFIDHDLKNYTTFTINSLDCAVNSLRYYESKEDDFGLSLKNLIKSTIDELYLRLEKTVEIKIEMSNAIYNKKISNITRYIISDTESYRKICSVISKIKA